MVERHFTKIKDVDLLFLEKLPDKDLFEACLISKYTNELCKDENFWERRFHKRFPEVKKLDSDTWRQSYLRRIELGGLSIFFDLFMRTIEGRYGGLRDSFTVENAKIFKKKLNILLRELYQKNIHVIKWSQWNKTDPEYFEGNDFIDTLTNLVHESAKKGKRQQIPAFLRDINPYEFKWNNEYFEIRGELYISYYKPIDIKKSFIVINPNESFIRPDGTLNLQKRDKDKDKDKDKDEDEDEDY